MVQDYWNEFETQLVGVADEIVPYKLFEFKTVVEPIPAMIKHKINERRRLLKSNKHYTTVIKTERIKVLNKEIKSHFNKRRHTNILFYYLSTPIQFLCYRHTLCSAMLRIESLIHANP